MTEKTANPTKRRVRSRKPKTEQPKPGHHEISERAYFIYLERGERDDLANWLRAERELMAG
jgi:Protein of unknown function (DUF2934)